MGQGDTPVDIGAAVPHDGTMRENDGVTRGDRERGLADALGEVQDDDRTSGYDDDLIDDDGYGEGDGTTGLDVEDVLDDDVIVIYDEGDGVEDVSDLDDLGLEVEDVEVGLGDEGWEPHGDGGGALDSVVDRVREIFLGDDDGGSDPGGADGGGIFGG